jgi:hypothetical protein
MPADTLDEDKSGSSTDDVKIIDGQPSDTPITDGDDVKEGGSAESSAAKGEDKDLLSVVRDVVEAKSPESPAGETEDQAGKAGGKETKSDDADEDEFKDVPFNKHPRFKQLIEERKSLKVRAQRSDNIEAFLRETGVADQEAANALEVIAMAKHQPAAAWERLKPWVQDLLVRAGEVLPDDLQQRVSQGEMSREAAIELSKARATNVSVEQQRQFERERQEQQRQEAQRASLHQAVITWETGRSTTDPNFERKLPHIMKEVAWRHRNGDKPDTPEGVKAQLEDVYKAVSKELAPLVAPPKARPAVRPVMGGQAASADLKPQPKNMLDVVQQSIEGMRQSA